MSNNKLIQYQGRSAALRATSAQLCKRSELPLKRAASQCQKSERICQRVHQITEKSEELRGRSKALRKRLKDSRQPFCQNNSKDSHAIRPTVEPHRKSGEPREPAGQQQGKANAKVGAENERIAFRYRGHIIYVENTLEGWKPVVDEWILPMCLTLGEALQLACAFVAYGQLCSSVSQVVMEMFHSNHLSQEECLNLLSSLHENIEP